jgi:hypothetical protein
MSEAAQVGLRRKSRDPSRARAARRTAICVVGVLFTPLGGASAHAEGERPVVEIAVGAARGDASLEEVVRGLLAPLGVELRWSVVPRIDPEQVLTAPDAASRVIARVWIDVSRPARAAIFISDRTSDRFVVRFLDLERGLDEVARESLGQIVESTVDALLSGIVIGVTREAARQAIARETPPEEGESGIRVPLALGYRADLFAGDPMFRHGPELHASFTGFGGGELDLVVRVSAQYQPPIEWWSARAGVELHGAGVRAAAGVSWSPGAVALRAMVAAGLDVASVLPLVTEGSGLTPAPEFVLTAPIVGLLLSTQIELAGPLGVVIDAFAETDLAGNHYDVANESATRPVLEPWPIRIGLGLALAITID